MTAKKRNTYSNVQKCIFSMHLKKSCETWKKSTGKTQKEMNAEVFGYSDKHMGKALSGNPSVSSMPQLAHAVNSTVEDMTLVNLKTIFEFVCYRLRQNEYKIMAFSLVILLWSAIMAFITSEWWAVLGIYLSASLFFGSIEKNFWGMPIIYSKQHRILKKVLNVYVVLFMVLGFVAEISKRI